MKKTNDKSRKETIDILLKSYIFKYVIPIVFIGVLLICLINRGAFVLGENQKLNTNEVINTIWDGTLEVGLSSLAIIEIIVFVYFCKNRIYSKKPLVIIAIALWIAIVFNSIVMDIPMAIGFVALANFSLIIIIVIASLYILPEESTIQTLPYDTALYKAISTTENRRIISVQMYKAIAQYKSSGNNEKIIYTVESGRSFNRKGYDINSIKTIEYELDRKIVDTFQTILYSYKDFLKDENDNTRDNLIALINVEINALNDKLLCI